MIYCYHCLHGVDYQVPSFFFSYNPQINATFRLIGCGVYSRAAFNRLNTVCNYLLLGLRRWRYLTGVLSKPIRRQNKCSRSRLSHDHRNYEVERHKRDQRTLVPDRSTQNCVCFAKKSVNRKPFLVRTVFFPLPKFS